VNLPGVSRSQVLVAVAIQGYITDPAHVLAQSSAKPRFRRFLYGPHHSGSDLLRIPGAGARAVPDYSLAQRTLNTAGGSCGAPNRRKRRTLLVSIEWHLFGEGRLHRVDE
jgi:hypothetical protein